jgi:hypothetical protein
MFALLGTPALNLHRPRTRAFAGRPGSVTERSEGNPEGVDGARRAGDPAGARAVHQAPGASAEVGSSNTRPGDRSVTAWPGWDTATDLHTIRPGYVINRWTGEILSSLIADVVRERHR